jgi:hypothetical protein
MTHTLETLKDYWQSLSLSHKDVQQFKVGNYYDTANSGNDKYPLVFWEMPYSITMNLDKPIDKVQVSFNVFLSIKQDDVQDAHQAISLAKAIGDAILLRGSGDDASGFTLDSANSISVREYTDDYVAGMRYDLTLTVIRDMCEENLDQYFNEID